METKTDLEFRWLQWDDLRKLDPIIMEQGRVVLNPSMSRAIAAYDGDKIVGYCDFTMRPHIDIWVDKEHRGSGIAERLTDHMVTFLYDMQCPEAYVVASNPHVKRLAEEHGMQKLDVPVFYKRG